MLNDKFFEINRKSKKEIRIDAIKLRTEIRRLAGELCDKLETLNLLNAKTKSGSVNLSETLTPCFPAQTEIDSDYDMALSLSEICNSSLLLLPEGQEKTSPKQASGTAKGDVKPKKDHVKHRINPKFFAIRFRAHHEKTPDDYNGYEL